MKIPILVMAILVAGMTVPRAMGVPVEKDLCADSLNPDMKLAELEAQNLGSVKKSVALTHLLNEAFTPTLIELHEEILRLTDDKLAAMVMPSSRGSGNSVQTQRQNLINGFNRSFEGVLDMGDSYFGAPFTKFNFDVMLRLQRSVYFYHEMVRLKIARAHNSLLPGSVHLRARYTYAESDLELAFKYAELSLLQAAAQMTAEPVGSFSAQEILLKVMSPNEKGLSAIVIYSLMLPPAMLGSNGSHRYLSPMLVENSGLNSVGLSPELRGLVKRAHDSFNLDGNPHPFEMGHGCPVGHCLKGADFPSLQLFLDDIKSIYLRLK